jgi:hypothetical protein
MFCYRASSAFVDRSHYSRIRYFLSFKALASHFSSTKEFILDDSSPNLP